MGATVRPLREVDLSEARRILRLAFGTFIGAPEQLLAACEALASERSLERMEAGVNTGRLEAYRTLLRHGCRTDGQGTTGDSRIHE
jgi:hypothetical protein